MALEIEAYHGVVKSWRAAEQKLLDEDDPARRVALAEVAEEWAGAFEEAVSELRAAAERGDTEAAALLDVAKAERALHGDGDGPERSG